MRKLIKSFIFAVLLLNLGLTLNLVATTASVFAEEPQEKNDKTSQGFNPLDTIIEIGDPTGLPNFYTKGDKHVDAPNDFTEPGVGTATSPILYAIDLFRYLVSGVALIMIFIAAVKLISTANEEEAEKMRKNLIFGVIGLLIIQLADVAVKKMFFGESGEAFESEAVAEDFARESVDQIRGIIGFVEAFVGIVAVLVLVIRGFTLIVGSGEEEDITKARRHVTYAIAGLAVIAISEVVVRGVIFPAAGEELPDVNKGKFILIELVNFITGFIAIICFAILFYGGYKYVVSAGNEEENEKLKKLLTGTLIALALTLGAFALVNTLVKFDPKEVTPAEETKPKSPEIIEQ
ncbi:hypothetical protein HY604_02160 [Candidatus Peregrinibacteria bacterium]|nr:hypothetical protein [Candidatus Peregrinibacteria bacterium]